MRNDNTISKTSNVLLVLGQPDASHDQLAHVIDHFCGRVIGSLAELDESSPKHLTICGDLGLLPHVPKGSRVIRELSSNIPSGDSAPTAIGVGRVPLLVHDVGVFYRRFFDQENLFERIQSEHQFQQLTESTKQSKALRTGIYLTDVTRELDRERRELLHFRLLRCSSNLTGPTDNFRDTDRMIMGALNTAAGEVFAQEACLNHVLAQIYTNTRDADERGRERKAKISAHSDKTKDMREEGLIAFCTFYDSAGFQHLKPSSADPYDWCHGRTSGLTRLHFKRKSTVEEDPTQVAEFSVTLYPNSVFIIPLSTNRLYTHAIRPSLLNVDRIPTRMGYVARCSQAEALFMDGQTYLKKDGALVKLESMTRETLADLRRSYYQENSTDAVVRYGEVHFSMNAGDYQKPIH
ncbi:MAG: hypothetical protein AAFX99_03960 [Myxococcota bacterium]